MPTYEARCPNCGREREYHSTIAQRDRTPICQCGYRMEKFIGTAPLGVVFGRFEPFRSMVDGSIIRNARELSEHNKRNSVVSLADGYSEETIKSGNYGGKKEFDPKERVTDIRESLQMVNNGYRPDRSAEHVPELDD